MPCMALQVTTLLSKADEMAAEAAPPADVDSLRESASQQGAAVKQAKDVRSLHNHACQSMPVPSQSCLIGITSLHSQDSPGWDSRAVRS